MPPVRVTALMKSCAGKREERPCCARRQAWTWGHCNAIMCFVPFNPGSALPGFSLTDSCFMRSVSLLCPAVLVAYGGICNLSAQGFYARTFTAQAHILPVQPNRASHARCHADREKGSDGPRVPGCGA